MSLPKILIIEDEKIHRIVLESMFNGEPYDVYMAEDGIDGLRLTSDLRPDLIILDYAMPQMNGLDFMRQLRNRKIETRVIICSAMNGIDFVVECLRLGASDFIAKPTSKNDLIGKIKRCLEVDSTVAFIDDPKSIILELSRKLDDSRGEVDQLTSQIAESGKLHLDVDLKRKNHDLLTKIVYVLISVLTAVAFRFIGVETEIGLIGAFIVLVLLLMIPMEKLRKLTASVKTVRATMEMGDAKK